MTLRIGLPICFLFSSLNSIQCVRSQTTEQSESAIQSIVADESEVVKLAGGMMFTEGPVWLPKQGKLVFSDIPNSRLMQWSQAQGLSEFRASKKSNGNILDLEGRLISCQHEARNVVRIDASGEVTVLIERYDGKRFNSPNDAAIRSDGSIWFTDPSWGLEGEHELEGHWVFKFDPDSGKAEVVIKDLAMPNGIVFSPDESRLYVSDTGGHPQHPDKLFHQAPACVRCYEVSSTGDLGKRLFTINRGSDGMAVDVAGNLYTTDADRVFVFNADGQLLTEIPVPENPANVCFGGADYRTLFITARTSLYSIRLKNAGAKPVGAKW